MWNLRDISHKKTYVIDRLKISSDPVEIEKLKMSLVTYIIMLDTSGSLLYTKGYNIMNKFTNGKFELKRNRFISRIDSQLFGDAYCFENDNYTSLLINLCNNIDSSLKPISSQSGFDYIDFSISDIVKVSNDFYKSLNDDEIYDNAKKILNDPRSINVTNIKNEKLDNYLGLNFNDYIFDKSYCNVVKQNNIMDYQVLNHEVMHGVDFYMKNKLPSENFCGFIEIVPFTIDYLFIDYLENIGFYSEEVQKMKMDKMLNLRGLVRYTKNLLNDNLINMRGFGYSDSTKISDIQDVLTPELFVKLTKIQSYILAYGLYEQIKNDHYYGINNLKKLMKNNIPKNQKPDFTHIGLSDNLLLEYSKNISDYCKSNKTK